MNTLFNTFDKQNKADWLAKVTKDLKGKAIEELDWHLTKDLIISPFAHQEDQTIRFDPIYNNKTSNSWDIGVIVKVSDFSIANKEAIYLLEQGATAVCFELSKSPSKGELTVLLSGIQHEWMSTHFLLKQTSWIQLSEHFLAILKEKGLDLNKVNCSFDHVGNPISGEKDVQHLRTILPLLQKVRFLSVNTTNRFAKKENVIDALAETINQGNLFLMELNKQNFDVDIIQSSIQFSISLTDSYLLNIATIRALKLLWQQVLLGWDEKIKPNAKFAIHLGVQTQTEDEHYNKIKATAQAMSAVIGGADRLVIYPSDEFKEEKQNSFSQRIALYVQHLMQLESYMNRVLDPAAGSYYIENLTQQLSEAAWSVFQQKQV